MLREQILEQQPLQLRHYNFLAGLELKRTRLVLNSPTKTYFVIWYKGKAF